MNNNTNENLNQTGTDNSVAMQNNVTNEQSVQMSSQNVSNISQSADSQAVSQAQTNTTTTSIEQRVNLVEKPTIQGIVPNKEVSTIAAPEDQQEEKIEVLEDVSSNANNTSNSSQDNGKYGLKAFFLVVLFGGLLAVVFYLPEISNYIETKKYLQTHVEEKITTGTLKCKYEDSTETLDYNYSLDFSFTDSKLNKLSYLLEIKGDANLDEEELNQHKAECEQISINVENLNGISISCSLSNGLYKQKQTLNYASIDVDAAMSAYTEAGGIYPDYENGESIDDIERNMNASGYTCERIK